MFQVLTLPEWECRAPEPFRRRGEAYWTCAELPLSDGWSFFVKADADQSSQLPARTIFVVSIEKLLHCLVELGPRAVRSVHQVSMGAPDDDDALIFNRITRIEVGEDPHHGWRKVYVRISAIVDARFSLIVDGETASLKVRRRGAQAPGRNVAQPSTISLKRHLPRVVPQPVLGLS